MYPPAPSLSVAMSVYNGERFLAAAIDSVLAQTWRDFEFLILDDGSTDGTARILADAAAGDPRIRVIARENCGLIASLNELVEAARAPIIARMDADDICEQDRFARQLAFLADHPEIGVVGTATHDIDEAGRPWTGQSAPFEADHDAIVARLVHGGTSLCHSATMFRRAVVVAAGGYRPAFRHCEDLDLWLRLSRTTRLANIMEPLLQYRRSAVQVSSRHADEQHIGAAIAVAAHAERAAGRPDPTDGLDRLPPIDALDALFGRSGIARTVRARVARGMLYSPQMLHGPAFDLVLDHVRDGGRGADLWRAVPRLLVHGEPWRAGRLAGALLCKGA